MFGGIAGGTAVSSTLTLESTTGAGSSDKISFLTGTQSERLRIDTSGIPIHYIGGTTPIGSQAGHGWEQHSNGTQNSINLFTWSNDTSNVPNFRGRRARSGTAGTIAGTASTAGELLTLVTATGNDGTNFQDGAQVALVADVAAISGHVPGRISLNTSSTTTSLVEAQRIDSAQQIYFPLVTVTTAGTAISVNTGSSPANKLIINSSSSRYKINIEDLDLSFAEKLYQKARPVWYRANPDTTSDADPAHGFYGYIAEEIAEIDPRVVSFGYRREDWENGEQGRQLKEGSKLVPESVDYGKIAVLQIAAMKHRIEKLEKLVNG